MAAYHVGDVVHELTDMSKLFVTRSQMSGRSGDGTDPVIQSMMSAVAQKILAMQNFGAADALKIYTCMNQSSFTDPLKETLQGSIDARLSTTRAPGGGHAWPRPCDRTW